jgi:hypothetical protein
MMLAPATLPAAANSLARSASVVLNARFPTNTFTIFEEQEDMKSDEVF